MDGIGKLVTVLRDRCPHCGSRLQVRKQGEKYVGTRFFTFEEVMCPDCDYSVSIRPEKKRQKRNIDTPWPDEM
jgi:DNA-directed RNA polymerase subunit RPC12/RpoP